jgi:hypothetical protein
MPTSRLVRDRHFPEHSLRAAAPLLLAATWLGCAKDEPTAPEHSSQSLAAVRTITGRIFGPDGRNICRTVVEGTMLVYLLNPEFDGSNEPFFGVQEVTCPDNSFSLAQEASTAHLRVELPINDNIDDLPWRNLENEFNVPLGGTNHPVNLEEGTPLGGRATFEGSPVEGAPIFVNYDDPLGAFGATSGTSGPDGRWTEFFGRSPLILQNDVRYQVFGCEGGVLGAKQAQGFPAAPFLFPSGRDRLTCRLETGPTTEFSHTATRLAVTPLPGDIGGSFTGDFFDQLGVGWGVQFPVPLNSSPVHGPTFLSQMFNGGLIVGVPAQNGQPNRVLLGVDGANELECFGFCRDLGLDGTVTFSPTGATGERKQVTWRYSDAGSEEAVGLQVIQHSVDGIRPHDYVLFRFRFLNTSSSTLKFFAGFFGDWDVDFDAFDDVGATALNGRLMYQRSQTENGPRVGTLLLGDVPVTGNFFYPFLQDPLSVPDQVRALRGAIRQTTGGPSDLRYIHGAGPITLHQHESQDVWLAVVAGENQSQLLANADAASDHVARLASTALSDAGETIRMTAVPNRVSGNRLPACKKNCRPR